MKTSSLLAVSSVAALVAWMFAQPLSAQRWDDTGVLPGPSSSVTDREDETPEEEIRALDEEQARAWLAKDQAALERLWSPEFVLNAPSNQILTRKDVFREMRTPRLELVSMKRTVERVTPFGDIMISMGVERYVPKNGAAAGLVRTQRYTNVWRREGDTWRKIARHAHVLPPDADQPPASSKPGP